MLHSGLKIFIGNEEREIKFTLGALEELEQLLPGRNIFHLLTQEQWGLTDIVSATWCGLKVFDRSLSRNKVEQWVSDYAAENDNGIHDLRLRLLAAIGISGLVGGEKSAFENILMTLDQKEESSPKK